MKAIKVASIFLSGFMIGGIIMVSPQPTDNSSNAPVVPQIESSHLPLYFPYPTEDCASDSCLILAECQAIVDKAISLVPFPIEGYCQEIPDENVGGYAHWPSGDKPITIEIDPFKGSGDYPITIKHELCHAYLMHYTGNGSHDESFQDCMN